MIRVRCKADMLCSFAAVSLSFLVTPPLRPHTAPLTQAARRTTLYASDAADAYMAELESLSNMLGADVDIDALSDTLADSARASSSSASMAAAKATLMIETAAATAAPAPQGAASHEEERLRSRLQEAEALLQEDATELERLRTRLEQADLLLRDAASQLASTTGAAAAPAEAVADSALLAENAKLHEQLESTKRELAELRATQTPASSSAAAAPVAAAASDVAPSSSADDEDEDVQQKTLLGGLLVAAATAAAYFGQTPGLEQVVGS